MRLSCRKKTKLICPPSFDPRLDLTPVRLLLVFCWIGYPQPGESTLECVSTVLSHEFQNLSYELLSQHVLNFVLMCQIQAVFQALRPSSLVTYHKGLSHHNSFFASHPVLYNSFFASHVVLYNSLSGVVAHSDVGIMRLFQNASGFSRMVNNDRTQDPRLRRRPKPESRSSLD